MMRIQTINDKHPNNRSGTTLSEVLVSLLVMSIGIVSLATLFPISVLRAVQANTLTNGTNLRFNAEAFLGIRPELYSVAQSWQPGIAYAVGDLVTPSQQASLKSPAVVFRCFTAGTSGSTEPLWNINNLATTTENPTPGPNAPQWTTFLLKNYVVDPLGETLVETSFRNTANGDFFGNDGANPPTPRQVLRAFTGLPRGIALTPATADDVALLPDSWNVQIELGTVTLVSPTSCTLNDVTSAITPAVLPTTPPYRIVLFDDTGKMSHVRTLQSWSQAGSTVVTCNWATALPTGFTPVRARVESRDRRFTWMLSVRRDFSGTSYLDVVVFYKRTFSGKDEQVYPATFTSTTDFGTDGLPGVSGVDDDGNGTVDDAPEIGWPGSDDVPRNWVVIQYDGNGDNKPFLKKGGFVADADNLRWYRIIDIVEGDLLNGFTPAGVIQKAGLLASGLNPNPIPPPVAPFAAPYVPDALVTGFANPKTIFLRVENPIQQTGPQPTTNGGVPRGFAILMRGIVDVYPIRTHLTWGN